jgi:two-component system, sensor histidine kinase and response regulator
LHTAAEAYTLDVTDNYKSAMARPGPSISAAPMHGPVRAPPSLQVHLLALILLVLVPTLGVVAMTLLRAGQSYREASRNQLLATANVVAQSVQSELLARTRLLAGYEATQGSAAPNIDADALFEGHLQSVLFKRSSSGLQAQGSAAHGVPADVMLSAASTGEAALSNIFAFDTAGDSSPSIALSIPRETSKAEIEVTTLIAKPAVLVRTLMRQGAFASALLLAVTDGTGRVIARSRDAERFIGKPVPDWKTLQALGAASGTFEARTIEGSRVIFAFRVIRGTPGWVAVVGEPLQSFNNRWRQPINVLLIASAAMIFVAFNLAVLLARKILRPIKHLADRARAAAQGNSLDSALSIAAAPSFVAEFETLRQSLESAEIETRRSHQALQQSYQSLREAEKLARIGSWSLDLGSGRLTHSGMFDELCGTPHTGSSSGITALLTWLPAQSRQWVSAAIAKCAETGESYGMEVEHLRADGTGFAVYVRGEAKRDAAGKIVGVAGTVQDISERQEERQRLAALADNLPSGAIYRLEEQADGTQAVTYMSAGIVRLIGVSATEIVQDGSAFSEAIHDDDRREYWAVQELSRLHGIPFDHEFRMNTRDGRLIWMHCRAVRRYQSDGRIVWDGIARDITAERTAGEALRQAKETAEIAERAKSDFLATMSHEIRTPMNTVIGMTRLTLQTELAPKQRNYLEKISISARALLGIINDILDFSKIEAGGLELEDSVFTLESVLESVSAITALPADEKELEIAYAVAADTPQRLRGDPLRLGQVLTNLVSNAVKFTETGEVVISIQPVLSADGSPLLQFSVRDTGIGLSPEQIHALFRPFSQATHETTREYGGTGLGLAICKQLVELMGGRIWAQSVPGKGSAFSFTIAAKPILEESESSARTHRSADLQRRRALIVDDNASARQILRDMVTEFGLVVETAGSGEQALALLRAHADRSRPFDIVLMDWRMPVMDGLEAARRIRADQQLLHMPAVLMVTAYGRDGVLLGAEQLGLEGVLIKPITKSVMFNTILEVLAPSSADRQACTDDASSISCAETAARYSQLAGKRILVVDDHPLNREVAGDFLLAVGAVVDTAVDGVEALGKLESRDFDAVLMDMHMPRMDGLTAVRAIRRQTRWANLPVIALTAQARAQDQSAGARAGMSAHLTKPIDETALYRTLVAALELGPEPPGGRAEPGATISADQTENVDNGPDSFGLAVTLQRFGQDGGRVERLLKGFLHDFSDAPQRLDRHSTMRDAAGIADLAHAMKGTAAYLSAHDFCTAADRLERAARSEDWEEIEIQSRAFRERLERLLSDIRKGVPALHALDVPGERRIDLEAILEKIRRAAPLIERGDYAASLLLEEICSALLGHSDQHLADDSQRHFDELELEAATAALHRLAERLEAARGKVDS